MPEPDEDSPDTADDTSASSSDTPRPTSSDDDTLHDPTGLDLARRVAAQLRGVVGRRPLPGPRRRPARTAEFSGAHPDERDPAPLGSTMRRLVDDSGWSTEVSVHTVLGRWASIVGPEVALHCAPLSYADGVVTVSADSTAWATQLRLLAPNVVARMNAELGDGTVVRIQVEAPSAPSWRRGRRSVRDGRGPRDTYG